MKKLLLGFLALASSLAYTAPLKKNVVNCVAKQNSEGHLIAVAYGFGPNELSLNSEESLGALYNSEKRTGYCQSVKLINNEKLEYTTVKVLSSESPIALKSPCQFSGENLHLSIDKKTTPLEGGYSYALKNGEHEFGSGDVVKIHF